MIPLETLLLFLAADAVLKLSPGPDLALVLSRSLTEGRRAGVATALGIGVAGFVQVPAVMLGLSSMLAASPLLFTAVKLFGAVYLAWLGLTAITRSLGKAPATSLVALDRQAFWQGFMTNLLNPKVILFLVAFLPQFVDSERGPASLQFALLGCLMKLNGTAYLAAVAILAVRASGLLRRSPMFARWQEGLTGVALLGLSGLVFATAFGHPSRRY